MSAPELPSLPENFAALLADDRAVADPGPEVRQRVLARLSGVIATGGGGSGGMGGGGGPAVGPASVTGASTAIGTGGVVVSKLLLLALVLGGIGVGATGMHFLAVSDDEPAVEAPGSVPAIAPAATEVMPAQAAPQRSVPDVVEATTPAPIDERPRRSRPRAAPSMRAESQLLFEAHAAVANGDGQTAMASLTRHARDYPEGALSEERDALEVRALALTGDATAARAAGERFLRAYPNSIHRNSVEAVLAALQ